MQSQAYLEIQLRQQSDRMHEVVNLSKFGRSKNHFNSLDKLELYHSQAILKRQCERV